MESPWEGEGGMAKLRTDRYSASSSFYSKYGLAWKEYTEGWTSWRDTLFSPKMRQALGTKKYQLE